MSRLSADYPSLLRRATKSDPHAEVGRHQGLLDGAADRIEQLEGVVRELLDYSGYKKGATTNPVLANAAKALR